VVVEARISAQSKGVVLSLGPALGDTTLMADRRRMRQVLGNVISNAVKFTSVGTIQVEVRGEEHDVFVSVKDTGPGIEPSALERIFDEFEQSSAGTRQRTGTGLGLSITRRLVHQHSGTVRAESVLGEGSTFLIRLPRAASGVNLHVPPLKPIVVRDKLLEH
jgi:signal transduction histidine kinase